MQEVFTANMNNKRTISSSVNSLQPYCTLETGKQHYIFQCPVQFGFDIQPINKQLHIYEIWNQKMRQR